jgi:radical SAM superfamily enzyme YgiQ (UPF0313 family)
MQEQNIIIKDWRRIDVSFGLVYPNIYSVAMASYSVRLLYSLINAYENLACERIFLPDKLRYPASKDYHSEDTIRSIETGRHPQEFDVLGFSIQFENDFRNILWLLNKANIPLLSEERLKTRKTNQLEFPVIIGGGPVSTSNPKPLSRIFDGFVIGDFEPNLANFFEVILNYKEESLDFEKLMQNLADIQGFYVPFLKNKPNRMVIKNLDKSLIPRYQLIAKNSSQKRTLVNSYFLEINRGCPFNCKFCISSYHNRPFRNRSYENIKTTLEEAVDYTDFNRVSLIGSCVSAHPRFNDICELIIRKGKELSIPSIRIEHLTDNIIEILARGNIKTITIAPETGSEKLRFALGKQISDQQIYERINLIKDSNIKNIKMYFLIGLPAETEDDIKRTIEMIKRFDKLGFNKNSLRISFNPMIPKLNTPYQKEVSYYVDKNENLLSFRLNKIKKELEGLKSIKLKIGKSGELIRQARLQTLFSLGDEKVSEILIDYYKKGATYGALKNIQNQQDYSINAYLLKVQNCYSPWDWKLIERNI